MSAVSPDVLDIVVALVRLDDALVESEGRRLLLVDPVYEVRGRSTTARAVLSESTLSEDEMYSRLFSDRRLR